MEDKELYIKYNRIYKIYCDWLSKNNMSKATEELYPAVLQKFGTYLRTYQFPTNYGNEPKNDIISSWKQTLIVQQAKQNTIRTYLYVLRAFFDWATKNKYYSQSPISNNDIPTSETVQHILLSEDEIKAILFSKPKPRKRNNNIVRDRAIVILILQCGLKVNEIINLQYSDLDFSNSIISIPSRHHKYSPNGVIMFAQASQCIQEYLSDRHSFDTTHLFGYYINGTYKPFTRQYIRQIICCYIQNTIGRNGINSEDLLWTNQNSPMLQQERQKVIMQSINATFNALDTSKNNTESTVPIDQLEQNRNQTENHTLETLRLPQTEEPGNRAHMPPIRHGKQLSFLDENTTPEISTTNYNFSILDKMSGYEFEDFVANLFQQMGYQADVNNRAYDWGVDIIVRNQFFSIGVQCKISNTEFVDNDAVQEIVAGIRHYNLDKGMVVTNNFFHTSTQRLAKENNVILWNRNDLYREIIKLKGVLK